MIIMDSPNQFGFSCRANHLYVAVQDTALWRRCKEYADTHDGAVMPITTEACHICSIDQAYIDEYVTGDKSDTFESFIPVSQTHGNSAFPGQSMFAR